MPTSNQLYQLANRYQVPIGFFYLNEIPEKERTKISHRKFLDSGFLTRDERRSIQSNLEKASFYRFLSEEMGQDKKFNITATLTNSPSEIREKANELREVLSVTVLGARECKTSNDAFGFWRERIERSGILVFQGTYKTLRGFAAIEGGQPVIGVSSRDAYVGRIFTLFHEIAHIMLANPSLDDSENVDFLKENTSDVERFCNRFAAEFLLPEQVVYLIKPRPSFITDSELNKASSAFKVSRPAILQRLFEFNLINTENFEELREWIWKTPYIPPKQDEDSFVPFPVLLSSRLGSTYMRRIYSAFHDKIINPLQAGRALGAKASYLGKLEAYIK